MCVCTHICAGIDGSNDDAVWCGSGLTDADNGEPLVAQDGVVDDLDAAPVGAAVPQASVGACLVVMQECEWYRLDSCSARSRNAWQSAG